MINSKVEETDSEDVTRDNNMSFQDQSEEKNTLSQKVLKVKKIGTR